MGKEQELKILIVDDEPLACQRARQLLSKIENLKIVGEINSGYEALKFIESNDPDIVLLDIQMPDLDGIRVLEAIDDPPAIIFSTAYDQFAVKAFEIEAVDYLLKPYSLERLRKAIEKAKRYLAINSPASESDKYPEKIAALNGLSTELVSIDDIIFFHIVEGVVFLIRKDGENLIYEKKLNDLEGILSPSQFFRANRQAIINLNAISSFLPIQEGGLKVKFKSGHETTVSRRRAGHLKIMLENKYR